MTFAPASPRRILLRLAWFALTALAVSTPSIASVGGDPCPATLASWPESRSDPPPEESSSSDGSSLWLELPDLRIAGERRKPSWFRLRLGSLEVPCVLKQPVLVFRQLYEGEVQIYAPGNLVPLAQISTIAPPEALPGGRSWLGWKIPSEVVPDELWLKVLRRRNIPVTLELRSWESFARTDAVRIRFFFATVLTLTLLGIIAWIYARALQRTLMIYLAGWSLMSAFYWFVFSGEIYLIPNIGVSYDYLVRTVSLAFNIGTIFGGLFARTFLALPNYFPILSQVHKGALLGIPVLAPLYAFFPNNPILGLSLNIIFFSTGSIQVIGSFLRALQGSPEGRFYLLGFGPILIVSLIQIEHFLTGKPNPDWLDFAFPGSFLVAAVVLTLATARAARYAEREMHHARRRAERDTLTGLLNRAALFEELKRMYEKSVSADQPCAIFFLDLDHFKRINDRFGHAVGDACLQLVADVLRSQVRASDILGRYGGEEFVLGCPNCDLNQALRIAEAVRAVIARRGHTVANQPVGLTTSIGIAASIQGEPLEQILKRADLALYKAKRQGRNQTVVDPEGQRTLKSKPEVVTP